MSDAEKGGAQLLRKMSEDELDAEFRYRVDALSRVVAESHRRGQDVDMTLMGVDWIKTSIKGLTL